MERNSGSKHILPSLTPLQFGVLNGMMDDSEDVEQLYLMLRQQSTPLHDVIDAITYLLRNGFIEVSHTNDERIAPVNPINFAMIHHYWFSPTQKGQAAWDAFTNQKSRISSSRTHRE